MVLFPSKLMLNQTYDMQLLRRMQILICEQGG